MQNTETKGRFVGEVLLIVVLQIIMLLFRLVEPINWPSIFPGQYKTFLNEFAYFGIELVLIIVIVAHFIFYIPFKELGLTKIKENIGTLVGNLCYVGVGIGVAYVMSQFSKNVEVNLVTVILQVITNFIAIAFLKELIFRGFLFRALLNLTGGKGIISSLITAVLFALNFIPSILVSLNQVSMGTVMQALMIPFAMGLYLSLVYYYTKNLWICTIIHGVLLSLLSLEQDFAMIGIEIIYSIGLVIYLVSKMTQYYKGTTVLEEIEEVDAIEETRETEKVDTVEETISTVEKTIEEAAIVKEEVAEEESNNTGVEYIILDTKESTIKNNQVVEKENLSEGIKQDTTNMMNELDELHQELKEKVREKDEIPDLLSVLSEDSES